MISGKLPFFPSPYSDELIYSVFARYHKWSNNVISAHTAIDLFGRRVYATLELPGNLQALCERLSEQTSITPEFLIYNHTLFPIYKAFLPLDRRQKISNLMTKSDKGSPILRSSGILHHKIKSPPFLKYCFECVKSDEDTYGEAYWHRSHQITGVKVCHKHRCWLLESKIAVYAQRDRLAYHCLESTDIRTQTSLYADWEHFEHYIAIADMVNWHLRNKAPDIGLDEILRRYWAILGKMNLVTANGQIKQSTLIKLLKQFYGDVFLRQIDCDIDLNDGNSWLLRLLRERRKSSHPLRHIILMRLLNIEPKSFWEFDTVVHHPFGKSPWPCLNPASLHYRESVIEKSVITRHRHTAVPVGTFCCKCGYSYLRRGPDENVNDRFRADKILSYGSIWHEKLLELAEKEKKSHVKIAAILKVCRQTVKKQLDNLRHKGKLSAVPRESANTKKRDICRKRIVKLRQLKPAATRSEIRILAVAEHIWLYRHDKKWLMENLPKALPSENNLGRCLDWSKKDAELAARVSDAAIQIKQMPDKPIRITVTEIGNIMGERRLSVKVLRKMPKTQSAINSVVESVEDFQIRRLHYAAEQILAKGGPFKRWKIIEKAGLSGRCSQKIAEAIDQITAQYGNYLDQLSLFK